MAASADYKNDLNINSIEYHTDMYQQTKIIVEKINVKKEFASSNINATPDESMAAEALRELGGVFESTTPTSELCLTICELCSESFTNLNDYQSHAIICNNWESNLYKCKLCNASFQRKTDLNNHLVCHRSERPLTCEICGNFYINKEELNKHNQSAHNEEKCNFSVENEIITNKKCHICGQEFQRGSSLTNHMKIHTYLPGRALHHVQQSPEKNDLNNFLLETTMCLNDLEEEEVDAQLEIPEIIAENCNSITKLWVDEKEKGNTEITFIPETQLDIKVGIDQVKPHKCKFCGICFTRIKALKSHLKIHTEYDIYECANCTSAFIEEKEYINHSRTCKANFITPLIPLNEGHLIPLPVIECSAKQEKTVPTRQNERNKKHPCSVCGKRFATRQRLERHRQIHKKKTYMCEICSAMYKEQSKLDEHRLNTHPSNSGYICEQCGKSFASRQGLWEHNKMHDGTKMGMFRCDVCDKSYNSRQGYLIHKRTHTGERPYGCRWCMKSFRDGGTLRKHEEIHTGRRHVCPVCYKAFTQKGVLKEHVRGIHAGTAAPNADGRYDCTLCQHCLNDRDELCAHIVMHSSDRDQRRLKLLETEMMQKQQSGGGGGAGVAATTSAAPDEAAVTATAAVANGRTVVEMVKEIKLEIPEIIAESFDSVTKLWVDGKEKSNAESTFDAGSRFTHEDNLKQHKCKFCGIPFARLKALKSHLIVHTALPIPRISQKVTPYPFVDCSTMTVKKEYLPGLQKGDTKHPCSICGKVFTDRHKLKRHKQVHARKIHVCEICSAMFKEESKLSEHRLNTHPSNSDYLCEQCGKSFSGRKRLLDHNRMHDGSSIGMYRCDECDKTYHSKQGFLIHKRTHTGERPFVCRWCTKSFRDGSTLKKHEVIHTGRRHLCPICSKGFTQKVALREHVRAIHAGTALPNADGCYNCTLCQLCLNDRDELCAHIVMHSSDRDQRRLKLLETDSMMQEEQARLAQLDADLLQDEQMRLKQLEADVIDDEQMRLKQLDIDMMHDEQMRLKQLETDMLHEEHLQNAAAYAPVPAAAAANDRTELETVKVEIVDDVIKPLICDICTLSFNAQHELLDHIQVHIK